MRQVYLPRSLKHDLSIQQVGDETLVYDERRHQAFCLNQVSSAVWAHCDGTKSVEQIVAALRIQLAQPVTEEIVRLALSQMEENGLLEPSVNSHIDANLAAVSPISRRSMMTRVGAGAVMMLPAIAAVMAPKPAQAYNGGVDSPSIPTQNDTALPGLRRLRRFGSKPGARR
jgi:hypothetical protein